ncbi:DUF2075 domain-containing protein [Lysobacter sp. CAU 1642]|uniref:DUF2075 domain-containing protein n=1 Tax=Pseudomarimonas salicorniae TaxID=2933270 RepID=A0ABT0GFQ2_9GAMM|nr:DUF2075 domain-containing protein [Lysobacter sp. CAU 1642]
MTRGLKGCYVYCVDSALADRFRSALSAPQAGWASRSPEREASSA